MVSRIEWFKKSLRVGRKSLKVWRYLGRYAKFQIITNNPINKDFNGDALFLDCSDGYWNASSHVNWFMRDEVVPILTRIKTHESIYAKTTYLESFNVINWLKSIYFDGASDFRLRRHFSDVISVDRIWAFGTRAHFGSTFLTLFVKQLMSYEDIETMQTMTLLGLLLDFTMLHKTLIIWKIIKLAR